MKRIAIIYMSNYYDWPMGGMLNYIINLLPSFVKEKDWTVDIWGATIDGKSIDFVKIGNSEYEIKNYTDVKTSQKVIPNFCRSFINCLLHKNFFSQYDIIYSHTSATTNALKLMFPKKFIVHHQHGLSYKGNHGVVKILNIGYTIAQYLADMTFFVASEDELLQHKNFYNNLFQNKTFFSIGSPIDYKYISKLNQQKSDKIIRFIYTGRIDPWKNIDLLVDAYIQYEKVCEKKCELILIGDGPEYISIKKKIKNSKCKTIYLPGRKNHEDLISELKKSDIFLFPSKGEGISLSMLEALAAGLPIVGFDVVGVRNLIIPYKTGIIVNEMNQESFVEAMDQAVANKDIMSKNCIEFAEKYDSESIANTIIARINQVYNERT